MGIELRARYSSLRPDKMVGPELNVIAFLAAYPTGSMPCRLRQGKLVKAARRIGTAQQAGAWHRT